MASISHGESPVNLTMVVSTLNQLLIHEILDDDLGTPMTWETFILLNILLIGYVPSYPR